MNWIKFSYDKRYLQGIQLSKNGYFVIATWSSDVINKAAPKEKQEKR